MSLDYISMTTEIIPFSYIKKAASYNMCICLAYPSVVADMQVQLAWLILKTSLSLPMEGEGEWQRDSGKYKKPEEEERTMENTGNQKEEKKG